MAKKKAAKKTAGKKKVAVKKKVARQASKGVGKKKRPAKKAVTKKVVRKATRPKRTMKKSPLAKKGKAPARKRKAPSQASHPPAGLQPNQYLDQMSVTIEGPDKSGDLVATESMGGEIRVHHTVHPTDATTPIPGQSYRDLKKLGEGTHEIEVVRTIAPAPGVTSSAPTE